MDEEIYIAGLHRGDEQVFCEIFGQYHTRLCYFASTLLKDDGSPEDVVQDAFVKLWQRRAHFADLLSVKAFLYITVKNHCLNILKHDKVVKRYGDLLERENKECDLLQHMMEAEVLEKIHQALKKLPAGCYSVLNLSYFEGLKNKDIATQLQISVNTVKTQKKRGIHLLRLILKVAPLYILFLLHFFPE